MNDVKIGHCFLVKSGRGDQVAMVHTITKAKNAYCYKFFMHGHQTAKNYRLRDDMIIRLVNWRHLPKNLQDSLWKKVFHHNGMFDPEYGLEAGYQAHKQMIKEKENEIKRIKQIIKEI